jgi:hypothetical protein
MSDMPLSLDSLIEHVRDRDGGAGPLDRVADAVELAAKLSRYGDHLVNFFIEEARGSGESWAAIGDRLGLSRQAVQKRYASQSGAEGGNAFFDKFVNDAKRVIVHAQEEARRRGVGYRHRAPAPRRGRRAGVLRRAAPGRRGTSPRRSTASRLTLAPRSQPGRLTPL